jgi:hypothetical protein
MWPRQRPQVPGQDVVERLHDPGLAQLPLQQPAAGDPAGAQVGDGAVAPRIVVARVDDDLAGQRRDREARRSARSVRPRCCPPRRPARRSRPWPAARAQRSGPPVPAGRGGRSARPGARPPR